MRIGPIERVVVVMPARNEAGTIGACVASIAEAAAHWGGPVSLVVGADDCHDETAAVARAGAGALAVTVVEGRWRNAGANRRAVTGVALEGHGARARRRIWLANTDADGTVPRDWLSAQVAAADRGADVVLGTVRLDPATTPPALTRAFAERYRVDRAGHEHVHGANLGLRGSAHDAVGGWPELAVGEDCELVRRCIAHRCRVHRAGSLAVTTSSRTAGRARLGFAADLARDLRELRDVRPPRPASRPGADPADLDAASA
jgi:glycosyltransferase involved in cell wall biosynthesis